MNNRPQLVLDIGGVLAANLSSFWEELAAHAQVPYDQLRARYKQEMSEALWSGKVTEEEFWSWLSAGFPAIQNEHARTLLRSILKPLPAMEYLPLWSQFADIHLLSNHRAEWVLPLFLDVQKHLSSITISSEVGFFKPHPRIYSTAQTQLKNSQKVLFVDDQEKNLQQAALLGWDTLLADPEGNWTKEVKPRLLPDSLL